MHDECQKLSDARLRKSSRSDAVEERSSRYLGGIFVNPQNATITPRPNASGCDEDGCDTAELLALVDPDAVNESRILCPLHRVQWLREVSNQ